MNTLRTQRSRNLIESLKKKKINHVFNRSFKNPLNNSINCYSKISNTQKSNNNNKVGKKTFKNFNILNSNYSNENENDSDNLNTNTNKKSPIQFLNKSLQLCDNLIFGNDKSLSND